MELRVRVHHPAAAVGLPLVVAVRDTSLQDVAAVTVDVARADLTTDGPAGVSLALPDALVAAGGLSVFAHAGPSPDAVALGDYLTVQHYPVSAGEPVIDVEVVRIG